MNTQNLAKMIAGYAYTAMLVTGILHAILGFVTFILACIGMAGAELAGAVFRVYGGVALFVAIWVLVIGALGIAAGIKQLEDEQTRKLKIAYMVTAILSACIFALVGMTMFILTLTFATVLDEEWHHYKTLGQVGSVLMALEFILAIVSSSICCCCSNTTPPTTVVIQAPAGQAIPVVQY